MIWDGIVYRIFATGAVVGVVGVFLAAVSRKREDRIAAMAALSFFVVYNFVSSVCTDESPRSVV